MKKEYYIYKPLKGSMRKWKTVTSNTDTIPSPEYLTKNNLCWRITFGKCEVEEAAKLLLEFFAEKKHWSSFTLKELELFCKKKDKPVGSALFGLICPWLDDSIGFVEPYIYVVQLSETEFAITTNFIKKLIPNGVTKEMIADCKMLIA